MFTLEKLFNAKLIADVTKREIQVESQASLTNEPHLSKAQFLK